MTAAERDVMVGQPVAGSRATVGVRRPVDRQRAVSVVRAEL